jgi:hypothetical protein
MSNQDFSEISERLNALVAISSLLLNKVFNRGANNARFNVLNRMYKIVAKKYGIANFSMGFAKDNNLK